MERNWSETSGDQDEVFASKIGTIEDIYGKSLEDFKIFDDTKHFNGFAKTPSELGEKFESDSTPLIFRILAGALLGDNNNLREEGIFRVTGSDVKIRELELHMSKGNYGFLAGAQKPKPHTVTNYWKRLLRHMKEPLIPYNLYEEFIWTAEIE